MPSVGSHEASTIPRSASIAFCSSVEVVAPSSVPRSPALSAQAASLQAASLQAASLQATVPHAAEAQAASAHAASAHAAEAHAASDQATSDQAAAFQAWFDSTVFCHEAASNAFVPSTAAFTNALRPAFGFGILP